MKTTNNNRTTETVSTNQYANLTELVAAYEAILAHEGLAPIDGVTMSDDLPFLEKRENVINLLDESKKKADVELDNLLGELKCFSKEVKVAWALGDMTDGQVHELYRDFKSNPLGFDRDKLSEEAIAQLSYGWCPAKKHPSEFSELDWAM